MVEGCDLPDLQTLGQSDHGGVDGPDPKIPIPPCQLDDARPVLRTDRHRFQRSTGDVPEEVQLRVGTDPLTDEVRDLRDDEHRYEERSGMTQQEAQARLVVAVARVDVRDQRAGVDDEGYSSPNRRFSSRISPKISSTR